VLGPGGEGGNRKDGFRDIDEKCTICGMIGRVYHYFEEIGMEMA